MSTPMTFALQIDGFCNCQGCIKKLKKALHDLGGVELLAMNPEMGEFTILTAKHAEVIKYAIKQTFPKKDVYLLQETNHPNQLPTFKDPNNLITGQIPFSLATPQGTANVHDIAKALEAVSHAKGLESVEFNQSSTFKMNFTNPENQPSTSSKSSSILHTGRGPGGHVKDDGYGDVPRLLPPPPNSTKPSAPLIPLTEQNYVTGYPADLYGGRRSSKYDDPHGCCTIL